MPNSNVQAIAFANTKARVYADARAQSYMTAKALVNFWNANSVSGVIPNDATQIADGAATDGRQIVTNAQITSIVTRAQEEVADFEATSSAKLNTILAVAVNGASKF